MCNKIIFRNYDYTGAGPNETSPGGSPYFGKPGGGEKSMGDWIKKRRKALKKRERKLRADYFNQLIKVAAKPLPLRAEAAYDPESWYYNWEPGVTLQTIIDRWQKQHQKMYNDSMPLLISIDELWPYREYERTRDAGKRSPEEWDYLKENMRKNGWDPKNPLQLYISNSNGVKIGEGNHRIAIAKELGIKQIPVEFIFYNSATTTYNKIPKALPVTPFKREHKLTEPLTPEQNKTVDEIMDLLFKK